MERTLASSTIAVVLAVSCAACDKVKPPLPELQTPSPIGGASSPKEVQQKIFSPATQAPGSKG